MRTGRRASIVVVNGVAARGSGPAAEDEELVDIEADDDDHAPLTEAVSLARSPTAAPARPPALVLGTTSPPPPPPPSQEPSLIPSRPRFPAGAPAVRYSSVRPDRFITTLRCRPLLRRPKYAAKRY